MGLHKIKKGLNLPINGEPEQAIIEAKSVTHVALLGPDYIGMRPKFEVKLGDSVKKGQLLFVDKKMPDIRFTSPGTGKIVSMNRGEKRVFLSIIIELDGGDEVTFKSYAEKQLENLDSKKIKDQLIESGLWTSIRMRPFGKIADPQDTPHSIFITAMDTNPLAPLIEKTLENREQDFINGQIILSKLTKGTLFLCKAPGSKIPAAGLNSLKIEEFSGPHPTGNPGTHIHFLDPVHRGKTVWYVNAQDVAAIGYLFTGGKLNVERIISLAGSRIQKPRLLRTRIGASIKDLAEDEIKQGGCRLISGSVFSGRTTEEPIAFLGRYHQQISVIHEDTTRHFIGWLSPGWNLFSVKRILLSSLFPWKKFDFTTLVHGGPRSIVPAGSYEKVMPLDILPNYLLRALAVDDIDEAEKLGCLELEEEDLALCTFVCPSKINHGENLRRMLTIIEKEG